MNGITKETRPKRRSLLFFPAKNKRYAEKAFNSDADSVIIDLEDSIYNPANDETRNLLLEYFQHIPHSSKEVLIRINDSRTEHYVHDLQVIKKIKPDAVFLPKVEEPEEISFLEQKLDEYDPSCDIEIIPTIETARGIENCIQILDSSENRITAAVFGSEDYRYDCRLGTKLRFGEGLINWGIHTLANACHARNIELIGPASLGYKTKEHMQKLEEDCKYLKDAAGVHGKIAINPNQIQTINRIFGITTKEIEDARKLIYSIEEHARETGVTAKGVDGILSDTAHVNGAKIILELAEKYGYI